jgi:hypothetical protein
MNELLAKTAEEKIDVLERLDRMLASAEVRRNNSLREVGRPREALGAVTRAAIDEVEVVEFREVDSGH